MLKTLFTMLLSIVVLFVGAVWMQPSDFKIERSLEIGAASAKVFEQINNLEKWENWSPWAKLDPNMIKSFEGPKFGVGAIMHWSGNRDAGEGSMKIVESENNKLIKFELQFLKPMNAINYAEFTFESIGNKTKVTWSMTGKNDFVGKAMCLVFNCEKMVGAQFESGLSNIKSIVETKRTKK